MTNLNSFAEKIKDRLAVANREPHWSADQAVQYMAQVTDRRRQFEELAIRICDTILLPRLNVLVSCFSNAKLSNNEPKGHCSCWFGYCERFPATVRVALALEHDVRFETIALTYEVSMMPLFIKPTSTIDLHYPPTSRTRKRSLHGLKFGCWNLSMRTYKLIVAPMILLRTLWLIQFVE